MNNIQQVYEILSTWKARFPDISNIIVFLGEQHEEKAMILRWEWKSNVDGKVATAIHMIFLSSDDWKNEDFEDKLFETIEAAYCKWEVGEE